MATKDGIYDYAGTIEVPSKAQDKLAHITISRFNDAVRWQQQEQIGGKPLRAVLRECYDQYNGILAPRDVEIAQAIGVDAYVNITAMKSGTVSSFLLESLILANQIPWTISPTPVPTLTEANKFDIAKMTDAAVEAGYRGDLQALVNENTDAFIREKEEKAKDAAENMEKLITDQCMEGGWNRSMYGFINDFCVYPYAILQGPVPVRRPRMAWSGASLKPVYETFYEFKSISPWDFWYSPDSPDTQRGTGVFVRERWTRTQLLDAAKMPSFITNNVLKVLDDTARKDYHFRWLSENPEQHDNWLVMWHNCTATVDVLTHYGYFSGKELMEYGIPGLEEREFYNAKVMVIGNTTIQAYVEKNPSINGRPIFATSFYKTQDRIPGYSIPQRIRDVERCYETCLRYLISNAANASAPITEADYSRLSKYMTDEDLGRIVPGTVYLADAEIGAGQQALRFYSIPSVIPQYQNLLSYFMDLADRVSNIPAALHGTAVGSGANRTFRGAAMLQGNAVKAIQTAVNNIDQFVFNPMGQMLYNYNMIYSKDESIKGDCKIVTQGAIGLMQKEINRQNSYEILQLVASAGQQLAQMPNGMEVVNWALRNVLENMGVPKDILKNPQQASMGEMAQAAQQGAPTAGAIEQSAPQEVATQAL